MEEKEIKLKPEAKSKINFGKLTKLFADKKKRYLYMLLFIMPFIIAICIFGYITYKEVKNLKDVTSGTTEVKAEYAIESMNYVLRDNATEVQVEYFTELKNAIEEDVDDAIIAGLVCKNYVADFYTWSNKFGQYDVGGLYYVYNGENETDDYKKMLYLQARDGFYKYLSKYINDYGAENLLEVESVEVVNSSKANDKYEVYEMTGYELLEKDDEGETYGKLFGDVEYDAYEVTCKWTYKESEKFPTNSYPKTMNFLVIDRQGRFEIVEASKTKIEIKREESNSEESEDETEITEESAGSTEVENNN